MKKIPILFLFKILCRAMLIPLVFVFLLIVPHFIERRLFFNSPLVDFGIRIIFTAWFCYGYWRLPELFTSKPKVWIMIDLLRVKHQPFLYLFIVRSFLVFLRRYLHRFVYQFFFQRSKVFDG